MWKETVCERQAIRDFVSAKRIFKQNFRHSTVWVGEHSEFSTARTHYQHTV
jgi:hypothetical protein